VKVTVIELSSLVHFSPLSATHNQAIAFIAFVFLYQVVLQQELEAEVISSSIPDRNLLMRYARAKVAYKISDPPNCKSQRWQIAYQT
jgi:hypothetical protein